MGNLHSVCIRLWRGIESEANSVLPYPSDTRLALLRMPSPSDRGTSLRCPHPTASLHVRSVLTLLPPFARPTSFRSLARSTSSFFSRAILGQHESLAPFSRTSFRRGASVGLLNHDLDGQDTLQRDLGLSDLAGSSSSADNTPFSGVVYLWRPHLPIRKINNDAWVFRAGRATKRSKLLAGPSPTCRRWTRTGSRSASR